MGSMNFKPMPTHIDLFRCQWCMHVEKIFLEVKVRATVIDTDLTVDAVLMPVFENEELVDPVE